MSAAIASLSAGRRRAVGILILGGLTLGVACMRRSSATPAPDPAAAPAEEARLPPRTPPRAPVAAPVVDGTAHLIEEVEVDDAAPCVGQPVTFAARLADEADAKDLQVRIGHAEGRSAVIASDHPGDREVIVRAQRSEAEYDVRTVTLHVHACERFRFLEVTRVALRPGDRIGFQAHPVLPKGERAGGDGATEGPHLRYAWDFGDGTTAVTDEPFVERDYTGRVEDAPSSTFVVRVEAAAPGGDLRGATSVTLDNLAYRNRAHGYLTPTVAAGHARWVDGRFEVPLTFFNHERSAIRFSKAEVSLHPCAEGGAPTSEVVPAESIVADTSLPPGRSERVATLSGRFASDTYCGAVVNLFGDEGYRGDPMRTTARFGVQLRLPQAALAAKVGESLQAKADDDPGAQERLDRVRRAMTLLGRDPDAPGAHVTENELAQLRLEGKLR